MKSSPPQSMDAANTRQLDPPTEVTDKSANGSARARARWDARAGLLFVLPMVLLFVIFRFGPAIAGVLLSFFDYAIAEPLEWKGIDNFKRLMNDQVFINSLIVTISYAVITVPLTILMALMVALAVRRRFPGVSFFRSVFFLPVITSLVLAGTIFIWIFSSDGPIAAASLALGFSGQSWLTSKTMVIVAISIVGIWARFGYGMLILLAALQEVPRELEEAALLDGAGTFKRFRYIIYPHIKPSIFFLAIIETTVSFQVFDLVYVMTQGGPARGSYTLVYMLYDQGFKYSNFGYAAAIGVVMLVILLAVALVQNRVLGEKKS